jgi:hypothetical protein
MVPITALWLPILLSAVAVFILSSIIHMVLGYHKNDYAELPNEKQVLDGLHKYNIPSGDYHFPHPKSMKDMKSADFIEKMKKGPVGILTIIKRTSPSMGKELVLWFIYSIIVGVFVAYIVSRRVDPGEEYLTVFRFAVVTAFAGYSLALLQNSIWYSRKWSTTIKSMFDGLLYALLTAGIFGWLWPTV